MATHTFADPIQVTFTCAMCRKEITLTVEYDDLRKWTRREAHVQDCFPYLSPADRELFLSQICGDCYDKLFK